MEIRDSTYRRMHSLFSQTLRFAQCTPPLIHCKPGVMYHHLCSCRRGSLYWDGVQDGPQLQVQVPEAVCGGEVRLFPPCPSVSNVKEMLSFTFLHQVHEHLSHHLPGHLAVWGHPQHHSEVRLASWGQMGRTFLQPKDWTREKQQPGQLH